MKRLLWFSVLLSLALLVLGTSLAVASETSQVTAVPAHIPLNGVTTLQICTLPMPPSVDTIVSLTVTDPSGSVWTHAASAGVVLPVWPATYNVNFGGVSPGWVSNDGDVTQTDEAGTYHVVVWYFDGFRGATFDCSAWFYTPEFGLGTATITALGFGGLMLARRRFKKPKIS